MINVTYSFQGKEYALGGLINGEIDNLIITSAGKTDVYDIVFANGKQISISDMYGLAVQRGDSPQVMPIEQIVIGDRVMMGSPDDLSEIVSITKREGTSIIVPRRPIKLNGILTFLFSKESTTKYSSEEQERRFNTCKFRTPEKVSKEVKVSCCSAPTVVTDFFCNAKGILLQQPVCWNCEIYEGK